MHDKIRARSRREIPAVTKILESLGVSDLPRPLVVDVIRRELREIRSAKTIPSAESIVDRVRETLEKLLASRLQPIINATGIVVHTNFGRSPLAMECAEAVRNVAASYNNLEHDLVAGGRGHRGEYVERALAVLCGAEAAAVVNNCAAALVLIVHHFVNQKPEVIVSRGELVQIGGGFRIGEILAASGATLREIGATNKTNLTDYARAISGKTALILKVHRSNFFMSGFVESPSLAEISVLARKRRIPFLCDLGSGALSATEQIGLHEHEPTASEALRDGADLVCFSGDKLLGGPQAGIILGKKRLVSALRREPLFRALRCDKLVFAALQTTVELHLNQKSVPAIALLQISKDELRARAAGMVNRLRGLPLQITIGRGLAKVGGGTLPRSVVPSITLDLLPGNCSLEEFAGALRRFNPPIVGYIGNDRVKLDLRTIFPEHDDAVVDAIRTAATAKVDEQ